MGTDQIKKRSLMDSLDWKKIPKGFPFPVNEYTCSGCGNTLIEDARKATFLCPYCGSEEGEKTENYKSALRPGKIIPFSVPRKTALDALKGWLAKGHRFAPEDITSFAVEENLHGVYIPYWFYAASTRSTWKAQSGFNVEKKSGDNIVKETKWQKTNGYFEESYDNVFLCMSNYLKHSVYRQLGGMNFKEIIPFDARYTVGFQIELYQEDPQKATEKANDMIDGKLKNALRSRIPGDKHKDLEVNTQKNHKDLSQIFAPIWIILYKYRGNSYPIYIHGTTAEVMGFLPVSVRKMTIMAIALVLSLIAITLIVHLLIYA